MLGIELHSWEHLMLYSLGGAAFAAVAVVVTTAAVVVLQREENSRTKSEFETYKVDTGLKLAEANARQREAELKILEMREKLGRPREIKEEILKNALADVPRRAVVVSYAPNDPDSSWLSLSLDGALRRAGWDVTTLVKMPEGIVECSNAFGGIYVLSRRLNPEEEQFFRNLPSPGSDAKSRPNTAFFKLTDALNAAIGENSAQFATCPLISDDRLYVAIWPRWVIFPKEPASANNPPAK